MRRPARPGRPETERGGRSPLVRDAVIAALQVGLEVVAQGDLEGARGALAGVLAEGGGRGGERTPGGVRDEEVRSVRAVEALDERGELAGAQVERLRDAQV